MRALDAVGYIFDPAQICWTHIYNLLAYLPVLPKYPPALSPRK